MQSILFRQRVHYVTCKPLTSKFKMGFENRPSSLIIKRLFHGWKRTDKLSAITLYRDAWCFDRSKSLLPVQHFSLLSSLISLYQVFKISAAFFSSVRSWTAILFNTNKYMLQSYRQVAPSYVLIVKCVALLFVPIVQTSAILYPTLYNKTKNIALI